jgi:outer membrane protein TolC
LVKNSAKSATMKNLPLTLIPLRRKKNDDMRLFGGRSRAACYCGALLMAGSVSAGAQGWEQSLYWWKDPFRVDGKTAASPNESWQPRAPLPKVPAPPAPAVSLATDAPLTLPELTEYALVNNSRTKQAWLSARAAAAALGVSRADSFPRIDAGYQVARTHAVSGTTGLIGQWLWQWGPQISLNYVLFDFGLTSARNQVAENRVLAANLTQNRALQEVVFQVEQAYYQLIGIDALVRINEQALKNVETSLDAARRRRESGVATVADVYRSETQVAQARLTLTRSRGELEKARGQLSSVVGLPVNSSIKVQTLSAPPQTAEAMKSIANYLETVKESRPDLVAAQAQVDAARATAAATAKAGLPSIQLSANSSLRRWSRNDVFGSPTTLNANGTPFNSTPDSRAHNLTLNLVIPLFSGFRDTYNLRQANVQIEQAEATRDALYRQSQLEVWQAFYDLQTVNGSISSTEALVKSAEQTAQATLARYQGGFGTILDLITAQQDETSARTQRIQSYLDWYTVLARLSLSVGAGNLINTKAETKQ